MSIRFKSLGSGSAGNATLVEAREGLRTSHLLIDCGMSQRKLTLRLQQAGVEPGQIDALFITHEHMREADAADRYEVVERLEHTALRLDDPSFRLDYYAL